MATYTVHEPPRREGEDAPNPDRFVLVRDGFHAWAFLFGPLWMVRHRLWLVLVLYLAITAILHVLLWAVAAPTAVRFAVSFGIALLLGMEASSLRRWTLARRGFQNVGVVVADDLDTAERRFFSARADAESGAAGTATIPPAPMRMRAPNEVIGLFPEPGVRR